MKLLRQSLQSVLEEKGKVCSQEWVSVFGQFHVFLTVVWIRSCCSSCYCAVVVKEYQAGSGFQGGAEGNTAIHLQGLRPALILVAALAVLHALLKRTLVLDPLCSDKHPTVSEGQLLHCCAPELFKQSSGLII